MPHGRVTQRELEQALQQAEEGSDQQRVFTQQLDEVQRLKSITQKLLLLAHADAGTLDCHREKINLSALIQGLIEDGECLAPNLRFEGKFPGDIFIKADRTLLQQCIQNLIGNAIKYNQPDGVVEVNLLGGENSIQLTISNTGPNISDADAERIFERFFRRQNSTEAVEGSGLGLSLAREIARAHGGEIELLKSDRLINRFRMILPAV